MLIGEGEWCQQQDWSGLVLEAFIESMYKVLKHIIMFGRVCDKDLPPVLFALTNVFKFFCFHL